MLVYAATAQAQLKDSQHVAAGIDQLMQLHLLLSPALPCPALPTD